MVTSIQARKVGEKDFVVYIVVADIRFETRADSWEACMRIVDLVVRVSDLEYAPEN